MEELRGRGVDLSLFVDLQMVAHQEPVATHDGLVVRVPHDQLLKVVLGVEVEDVEVAVQARAAS